MGYKTMVIRFDDRINNLKALSLAAEGDAVYKKWGASIYETDDYNVAKTVEGYRITKRYDIKPICTRVKYVRRTDVREGMMEYREDCFAYKGLMGRFCSALTVDHCTNCVFYKTKEQFQKDVEKAEKRLSSLGSTKNGRKRK